MGETKRKDTPGQEVVPVDKLLPAVEVLVNDALKAVDEFPALKQTITANTDIDNIIMYRTYIKCPYCGRGMFWDNVGWSCCWCGGFILHTWLGC